MSRVSFREIRDRFRHIDARFVSCTQRATDDGCNITLVVRSYAWWEHPK